MKQFDLMVKSFLQLENPKPLETQYSGGFFLNHLREKVRASSGQDLIQTPHAKQSATIF